MTARPAFPRSCAAHAPHAAGWLVAAWLLAAAPVQAVPVAFKVVDGKGEPLADAVVAVDVRGAPARAAAGTSADMAQQGKQFRPRVLAIQTGTAVNFPNLDTVRHHVYSFSPAKSFELKLYAGTPSAPVVFDKPGTAVLGCNIHDAMSAQIHIVDTPYFARTDAAGAATIDLPAGEHRLQAWHASLPPDDAPPLQPLTVGAAPSNVAVRIATP